VRHDGRAPATAPADTLQAAANALRGARAAGQPIARNSEPFGLAGIDAAYALDELNAKARRSRSSTPWPTALRRGRRRSGTGRR